MDSKVERCSQTTCPYCGVGCGVTVSSDAGHNIIAVQGDADHPANSGRLCVKGTALHETNGLHGRLLQPHINGEAVAWQQAIDEVASRIQVIRERYGAGAIAFYLSGQLLTEDYYVSNKFAKGFVGTPHVDTNSRLCMASAVASHKRAFGADVVPCCYEDIDDCDLFILVGSNAAWTHPVLYQRLVKAKKQRPSLRVVVIDPRRTASCDVADLHLQIRPGADGLVYNALLAYLHEQNELNEEYIGLHTRGFDTALAAAMPLDIADCAAHSGVSESQLTQFFSWFAETERCISFYSQGINQSSSGTDKGNAIINCHLATGRIGKPGMGPFSITGQPNAMGGREVGALSNQLAAHMDYDRESCDRVSRFWKSPHLPSGPGLKAVDMFEALERGDIKLIWIMATNPAMSMPQADRVRAALANCEQVIVSDCVAETDTTVCADILLPALGWGEKDGTVTNAERRISRQRSILKAPGEARPDWWIVSQVARRMGYGAAFRYKEPYQIFREHCGLSTFENKGRRAFDLGGLADCDSAEYDELVPFQWPVKDGSSSGTERMLSDGHFYTDDGRASFVAIAPRLPSGVPDDAYPIMLNTGRVRDQWHSMTRTSRTMRLMQHMPAPHLSLHPETAARYDLVEGSVVCIESAQGSLRMLAAIDSGIQKASAFAPIHWSDCFASQARVGAVIANDRDPISGQPEFKATPVRLKKITTQFQLVLLSRSRRKLSTLAYWDMLPMGDAYCYYGRSEEAMPWEEILTSDEDGTHISYSGGDLQHTLVYRNDRIEEALFVSACGSELPDQAFLSSLLELSVDASPWQLLAGKAAGTAKPTGRLICACYEVGENAIRDAIELGNRTAEALGRQLRCGTNCGSCLPELAKILNS